MKILLVTPIVPRVDARNGAARVMHGQLTALREAHEVSVVTFSAVDPSDRACLRDLVASGVEVHEIGAWVPRWLVAAKRDVQGWIGRRRGWPALGAPGLVDRTLPLLLQSLTSERRFDILQVENIGFGPMALPTTLPRILTEHEVFAPSAGDKRDGARYQPALWRQFDRVQVFSGRDADAIRALAPDVASRVRVNPFGVALPPPLDPARVEPSTILFVGGFRHPPNIDAALWLARDILPRVRARHPAARLVIVGEAPPRDISALADAHVEVIGGVDSVQPYMERAAVVAAPVRTGGGMRVKVLEALAAGKAVVTTTLGTEGLLGAPAELPLSVADAAAEFAAEIVRLLADPAARIATGREARLFASTRHTWADYRMRLERTYAEVLSEHHGA